MSTTSAKSTSIVTTSSASATSGKAISGKVKGTTVKSGVVKSETASSQKSAKPQASVTTPTTTITRTAHTPQSQIAGHAANEENTAKENTAGEQKNESGNGKALALGLVGGIAAGLIAGFIGGAVGGKLFDELIDSPDRRTVALQAQVVQVEAVQAEVQSIQENLVVAQNDLKTRLEQISAQQEILTTELSNTVNQDNYTSNLHLIDGVIADNMERVSGLEAQLQTASGSLSDAADTAGVDDKLLTQLQQTVDQIFIQHEQLVARNDESENRLSELTAQQTENSIEIGELLAAADSLEKQLAQTLSQPDYAQQSTMLVAVNRLINTALSGRPFQREMRLLEEISPQIMDFRSYDEISSSGLPTISNLHKQFLKLVPSALSTEELGDDASYLDQALSTMRSIAFVRRTGGAANDDSLAGQLAGIEAALEDGDIPSVERSLAKLPNEARAVFSDWRRSLARRLEFDDLASRVLNFGSAPLKQ